MKSKSQKGRKYPFLDPGALQIDNRSLADHLAFIYKFSEYIPFFSPKETEVRTWKDFLEDALIIQFIQSAVFDLRAVERSVEKQFSRLGGSVDAEQSRHILLEALTDIVSLARQIFWQKERLGKGDVPRSYWSGFLTSAEYLFSEMLPKLYSLKPILHWDEDAELESAFEQMLPNTEALSKEFEEKKSPHEDVIALMKTAFNEFFIICYDIKKKVEKTLKYLMHDSGDNQPHIALLISFLRVYHAFHQKEQNRISEKHLKYYYHDCLRLKKKGYRGDRIIVHADIKKGLSSFFLPRGTEFAAGKNEAGDPIVFKTDFSVNVTSVKIKKIGTQFISFDPHNRQGGHKGLATGLYGGLIDRKILDSGRASMPVLGQEPYCAESREIRLKELGCGFLIASEKLCMKEGNRVLFLKIGF
ncbi:MAG: hypothetical protein MI784_03055, partial [Cytophagales bacterium]|nr:hypothetical protein [Cytophagales bacterium]